MANSTKTTFKPAKTRNYKSVVRMAEGGNVSELNYSERREYIEENYAPFITDAQMIFSIYDSGIEYDYKGDRKEVVNKIIQEYKNLGDYTEATLPQETIYEIQDWDLVRKEIDPDTDEVIGKTALEPITSDNTFNFSYKGLVNLNWRVYHDEEYDRFYYVITPNLGGDIRGNYGDAIILEGNDKEELFYRFYEGFVSGGVSVYFKFKDGSEIRFDSEKYSNVFNFRLNEVFEPTGMAQKYLNDFEKFDSWDGDEFLEETIDIYLSRNGQAPKMMAGGSLYDETPMAYVQILGENNEGKWINLTDYADGKDVMNGIYAWMDELNKEDGGSREEYEVLDYEGFGKDLYDEYMGENEFDEIIEAYEKYQSSDFPADVISAYKNDSGSRNDSLSDVIDEMDNNYFGKYENIRDFGYEMVNQGVYSPSISDVYITDTDKRIIAGEEADSKVDVMRFEDFMDVALNTQSEYEVEKTELEDKISEIQSEIDDLTDLQSSVDDDDEYETIAEQIEEKEVELDDVQNELDNIDSRFEDEAKEEAREIYYDEIYDKLENDLDGWLSEMGYDTDSLNDISFISIDYEQIGEELSADYLIIEFDGELYFFNNYKKGGRIKASKLKPKFAYYIVENNTKKLVSGYETKEQATEQRKLLVKQYPSMRFEIFTLANLEKKTDLDVYSKKDYVELSTLDKIKKVSVDAYRYGEEKAEQVNEFLKKHDVKGKIKRGARSVWDKTKQGGNWLKRQWEEADFGDGKGKAKFFADGGEIINHIDDRLKREGEVMNPQKKQRLIEIREKLLNKQSLNDKDTNVLKNEFNYLFSDGGNVSQTQLDAYRFVDEIVEIHKDKKKVREVILDRVNSPYGRTSNQFVDAMWDRYNMIFYKEDYPNLFSNGGNVSQTDGSIDAQKKGVAKRIKIKNWYKKTYPSDELGEELNDNITFYDLYVLMYQGNEVYSILSVSDSIVRERVFEKLSEILGVDYEYIYNIWLRSDKYEKGGAIGFVPFDVEEKLVLLSKWGGIDVKGVIGLLNAMIDTQLTDNDLVPNPTKNTRFQREKAIENKVQQIWKEIQPNYKGNLKGNQYYSTIKELVSRNYIYENLLQRFKPFRKYQTDKFANGGGVDNMKRFDVDFYDSANSKKETNIELTIKQDSLDNAIQDAIKKAEELKKNYIEFYHRGFFLGSINFENSKEFVRGKYYKNYISNTLYEEGGESNALFEIVVVTKGLEKDGGQIIKDRFSINSISVNEAKNIARKMWEEEMGNSDFHIIDILTDTEYKEKYLSEKFNKGGESGDSVKINSISELYDWEESSNYPYARDMVAYFIFGDREDNLIHNAIRGSYSRERADESQLSEIMLGYEYNWMENMEQLDVDTVEALGDLTDYYVKGGGVNNSEEEKVEYDVYDNKRMLLNQANEIGHHSEELIEQVNNTKKVPAWLIAKMERATTDLSDITHYLDGENKMAHGGNVGDVKYEILPHKNKFVVAKTTFKQQGDDIYPSKDFIYGFNDKLLEFDDIKSAQLFIDNIEPKYPYGITKESERMYLMASQLTNNKQPQKQIVYYIPQQQVTEDTEIVQNIRKMQIGGDLGYDNEFTNDFLITNLIELANELQSVRYYVKNRFKETDFESKNYMGRLTIVFKEPASVNVINALSKFIERAEDCHHIFEQSVNVSGSEPNGLSINLLSDKFSDIEFGKGGKVYDFAPKKINVAKTKKITTQIGDFNLGLISKDFVYFVNMEESDDNGNTLMYDNNGELLSDNYFASNELYETLERESTFDFIHPMMEIQRQEILKGN
jgi:hypothetical protein